MVEGGCDRRKLIGDLIVVVLLLLAKNGKRLNLSSKIFEVKGEIIGWGGSEWDDWCVVIGEIGASSSGG